MIVFELVVRNFSELNDVQSYGLIKYLADLNSFAIASLPPFLREIPVSSNSRALISISRRSGSNDCSWMFSMIRFGVALDEVEAFMRTESSSVDQGM